MSKPSLIRESLATTSNHPRNNVCTTCIQVKSQRTEASNKHLTFMYVINNPSKAMGMPKPVVIQFLTLSFIPFVFPQRYGKKYYSCLLGAMSILNVIQTKQIGRYIFQASVRIIHRDEIIMPVKIRDMECNTLLSLFMAKELLIVWFSLVVSYKF